MSRVCRTCLRKCDRIFGINQPLEFADGTEKLSVVLRFCIPELYLGVTTHPEICHDCREALRVAYVFKKKCLSTETILGEYLKTVRCTGRSVELWDVLTYLKDKAAERKHDNAVSALDIISEWESPSDGDGENLPAFEVRQSAPNPKGFKNTDENSKTGFLNTNILANILKGIIDEKSKDDTLQTGESQPETDSEPNKEDFPKITSVFSVSEDAGENDKENRTIDNTSLDSEIDNAVSSKASGIVVENRESRDLVEIKNEPFDVEINSDNIDLRYTSTDEETLDASETGPYENIHCNSSLQGIIDSLPEIKDCNQYVDVPDFVQINNFGPRELEALRQQQLKRKLRETDEDKGNVDSGIQTDQLADPLHAGVVLKPNSTAIPPDMVFGNDNPTSRVKYSDNYQPLSKRSAARKGTTVEANPIMLTSIGTLESPQCITIADVNCFKKLSKVVYIGGRKYIKSNTKQQFMLATDAGNQTDITQAKRKVNILSKEAGESWDSQVNSTSNALKRVAEHSMDRADSNGAKLQPTFKETAELRPNRKRRIKIVPVTDNPVVVKRAKTSSKDDDKDVVVLFTNYSSDGFYVNDHDYLVNPYKRNKILIEVNGGWYCMCYICTKRHLAHLHVGHMNRHGTICNICKIDFGTPYMLNVHVRTHVKSCHLCAEDVPYGLMKNHELKHAHEKLEVNPATKKYYKKQRSRKDQKFIAHENETRGIAAGREFVRERAVEENQMGIISKDNGFVSFRRTGRKRKRYGEENNVKISSTQTNCRVLRSKVRKSYNEIDGDISDNVKDISPGTGPP